jgi:hypothetical protein
MNNERKDNSCQKYQNKMPIGITNITAIQVFIALNFYSLVPLISEGLPRPTHRSRLYDTMVYILNQKVRRRHFCCISLGLIARQSLNTYCPSGKVLITEDKAVKRGKQTSTDNKKTSAFSYTLATSYKVCFQTNIKQCSSLLD